MDEENNTHETLIPIVLADGDDNGSRDNNKDNDGRDTTIACLSHTATDKKSQQHSTSLPLYYDQSELCTLGRPGMECMPLRSPPGPYHYHVTDQTKSLQELQNEVGALLEFRDLVIETFPDLKHKMASISASNTITGIPTSSSLASRRDWEPGIRVRRKIPQKEIGDVNSSSSLIRSRSNSHSGKKEPKSGEGNGSVVQDSGFSTETNSSKETHSASSTTGTVVVSNGQILSNTTTLSASSVHRLPIEAEDELWNLLDVIHRKSTRLREEVEYLQTLEKEKCRSSNNNIPEMFKINLANRISKDDVQILRKERDRLLDKLSEMEAETIAGRIKANKMQDEMDALHLVKRDLEEQLKAALSQKIELNSRIHDMHQQFVNKSVPSSPESSKPRLNASSGMRKLSADATAILTPPHLLQQQQHQGFHLIGNRLASSTSGSGNSNTTTTFTPIVLKSSVATIIDGGETFIEPKHLKNELNLGRLDGLVSSPNRSSRVRLTDSKKIAAILLETNIVELQRHLLTLTVQNQVLTQRLEQATKSKIYLIKKLDKAKEDIDDLRFQLEEKNIELEGTKAQLRVLESKTTTTNKSDLSPEHYCLPSRDSTLIPSQVSTPSMKAMVPLAMDELHHHNSSSTESAQDHPECDHRIDTPKKRPSKIPLLGQKGYLAPKPPTGRSSTTPKISPSGGGLSSTPSSSAIGISGPPSARSLSKSTGSLIGRSGPPSSVKRDTSTILNRPDSAQSLRKDSSLGNCSRSSSIPISAKISPPRTTNSPVPKTKRDTLSSRVRNMDSLSRINQSATTTGNLVSSSSSSSTTNLYKTNSKKDLSSNFSTGQNRNSKQITQTQNVSSPSGRRVSNTSVNSRIVDLSSSATAEPENGKISTEPPPSTTPISTSISSNYHSISNRDLIKEYLARNQQPPAIFKPSFTPYSPPPQLEIAYKHPRLLMNSSDDDDDDKEEESIYSETINPDLDGQSIEIVDASKSTERNSRSIARNSKELQKQLRQRKMDAFSSIGTVERSSEDNNNECKLIGKVKPNLVRTWEQLNRKPVPSSNDHLKQLYRSRSLSNNSGDEKILYPISTVDLTTAQSDGDFRINVMIHSGSSEDFYDSIDDRFLSDFNGVSSIFVENDDDGAAAAGEVMAEYDLLDKRKICWSIDSERLVYKKI